MEEKIKICPLCGMRFVWGKCDCGSGEFYDTLVDARYWAGKMYRRALEAEEMLHNLAETGLVASFEDACKITKLKSENAALSRKLAIAEAEWREGVAVVSLGVELMTVEQLSQWRGARAFLDLAQDNLPIICGNATNPPSVTLDEYGMDANARCPTCGGKMQIVRPGKYQPENG